VPMTDDLYARYKEALLVGHVAVYRGSLEEAAEAYRTAAAIAPARALPHASLGGVLLRLARLEDSLAEYSIAVGKAPHDEGALVGQAEALTMAGRGVDAAAALDRVSEIQAAAGRLSEAAETLRRAIELEASDERSRRRRGLLREIRLSEVDQAAEKLLARALRLRDEPSGGAPGAARSAAAAASAGLPIAQAAIAAGQGGRPASGAGLSHVPIVEPAPWVGRVEGPLEPTAVEPSSGPAEQAGIEAVEDRDDASGAATVEAPGHGARREPSGDELLAAAEASEASGDATFPSLLTLTARAYAREGLFEAALDVTDRLLGLAPGDVDAHLVLVDMYLARGWSGLAAEKLVLLGRLARLNDDEETRRRLCAVASQAFPTNERLAAICS